jgi:hypothetical protein
MADALDDNKPGDGLWSQQELDDDVDPALTYRDMIEGSSDLIIWERKTQPKTYPRNTE